MSDESDILFTTFIIEHILDYDESLSDSVNLLRKELTESILKNSDESALLDLVPTDFYKAEWEQDDYVMLYVINMIRQWRFEHKVTISIGTTFDMYGEKILWMKPDTSTDENINYVEYYIEDTVWHYWMIKVENDGDELQNAPERLREDSAIVMAAVKQDWHALKYASDKLKSDLEVAQFVLTNCPTAFWLYVPKETQDKILYPVVAEEETKDYELRF